jgi:hypothetical protein
MDKAKSVFAILGLGITIGVVVVIVLIFVVGAIPKSINVGGVQFEIPTSTPVSSPQNQQQVPPVVQPTTSISQPTSAPVNSSPVKYDGWVICWHGRDGYEYLIAYPESDAKQGINLNIKLTNAQGRQLEVANDSLKMCYVDGEWYGYPDPNEWFPKVSYLKLLDKEILVCSDSPGCQGSQWTIRPEKYFPWNAPELQAPKEAGIHIIAFKSSQ